MGVWQDVGGRGGRRTDVVVDTAHNTETHTHTHVVGFTRRERGGRDDDSETAEANRSGAVLGATLARASLAK